MGVQCGHLYTTSFWYCFPLCLPRLGAVCDVGFDNNKWLNVFRCHVKPREGHVLSEYIVATGVVSGTRILTACVEAPTPVEWHFAMSVSLL